MTNDDTKEGQAETLPDVRPELAEMGRGSMQRRIMALEAENADLKERLASLMEAAQNVLDDARKIGLVP